MSNARKGQAMKIKVYNYALWRDEASGAYFTKVNGTSVEISKEVYYELMKHENEDRYQEAANRKRLPQFGHPLGDEYELSDEIPDPCDVENESLLKVMVSEALSRFDERDRIIIRYYLTGELTARQIEGRYDIPRNTVSNRARMLKKFLQKFFLDLGQN